MLDRSVNRNRTSVGRGRAPEGRRVLDLAEGILIGLRRYSSEAAFGDLVAVAYRHDITVSAAASALVAVATGGTEVTDVNPGDVVIAQHEWCRLLPALSGQNAGDTAAPVNSNQS